MEPLRREMLPVLHRRHDHGEGLELEALLAEDGVGSKERDDLRQKIVAVPYHVDERPVSTTGSGVGPDPAAAESDSQELEDRSSLGVLADVELGTSCQPNRVDGFRWTATWKLPSPSTYPAR